MALQLIAIAAAAVVMCAPPNATRVASTSEWCDCGAGNVNLTVWPDVNISASITLSIGGRAAGGLYGWMDFGRPVSKIGWLCDGMNDPQQTSLADPTPFWSAKMLLQKKGGLCGKSSGRLKFVGWRSDSSVVSAVPYASGEGGYNCIKIPVLLQTAAGTLLAIAEARRHSCSDFAWTDLVVKRSSDGGALWSDMAIIRTESAPGTPHTVIGNAAPVQLSKLTNGSQVATQRGGEGGVDR